MNRANLRTIARRTLLCVLVFLTLLAYTSRQLCEPDQLRDPPPDKQRDPQSDQPSDPQPGKLHDPQPGRPRHHEADKSRGPQSDQSRYHEADKPRDEPKTYVPRPTMTITSVDCRALIEGDDAELKRAGAYMTSHTYTGRSDSQVIRDVTADCAAFKRSIVEGRGLVTDEELAFPLGFTILAHERAEQVVRLLSNIYRPHNVYCIHVDKKAHGDVIGAIAAIKDCLPNVFVPEKLVTVVYGHFSRLEAELNCMRELLLQGGGTDWRYLINLTGQMFPLKTPLEMVKILGTYEGSNDVEGLSRWHLERLKHRVKTKWAVVGAKMVNTRKEYPPPPLDIHLVKGSAYGAYTREFIQFIFSDSVVSAFVEWCRHVYSPDEVFWATVNSRWVNPMFRSPGGFDGTPERKPWLAAHAAWKGADQCGGKWVRAACVFGVGDLPRLASRRELFANKFYADYEYLAVDCLEEWLSNKTLHLLPIDLEYYRGVRRMLNYKNL